MVIFSSCPAVDLIRAIDEFKNERTQCQATTILYIVFFLDTNYYYLFKTIAQADSPLKAFAGEHASHRLGPVWGCAVNRMTLDFPLDL